MYPCGSTGNSLSKQRELIENERARSSQYSVSPSSSDEITAEDKLKVLRAEVKKKYQSIPNKVRMVPMIEGVENKGEKNYSSAKSICQELKKEGRSKKKLHQGLFQRDRMPYLAHKPVSDSQQNSLMMNQSTCPENRRFDDSEDPLIRMKNRLLRNRDSFVSSNDRYHLPSQKRQHTEIEEVCETSMQNQLKKLDELIEQNNRLLESMTREKISQRSSFDTINLPSHSESSDNVYILSNSTFQTLEVNFEIPQTTQQNVQALSCNLGLDNESTQSALNPSQVQYQQQPNFSLSSPQSQVIVMMNATNDNVQIFTFAAKNGSHHQSPDGFQNPQVVSILQTQQFELIQPQPELSLNLSLDANGVFSNEDQNSVHFGGIENKLPEN